VSKQLDYIGIDLLEKTLTRKQFAAMSLESQMALKDRGLTLSNMTQPLSTDVPATDDVPAPIQFQNERPKRSFWNWLFRL
jgi:hypothetical protein